MHFGSRDQRFLRSRQARGGAVFSSSLRRSTGVVGRTVCQLQMIRLDLLWMLRSAGTAEAVFGKLLDVVLVIKIMNLLIFDCCQNLVSRKKVTAFKLLMTVETFVTDHASIDQIFK